MGKEVDFCLQSGSKACRFEASLAGRSPLAAQGLACIVWWGGSEKPISHALQPGHLVISSQLSCWGRRKAFHSCVFMVHGLSHPQPETLVSTVGSDQGRQVGCGHGNLRYLPLSPWTKFSQGLVFLLYQDWRCLCECLLRARWGQRINAGWWRRADVCVCVGETNALAACLSSGSLACNL